MKKKYGIVFQGKENTFIEVTGKEIRKYLNSPIPVEQKKALQNLMIHSWIESLFWGFWLIAILLFIVGVV